MKKINAFFLKFKMISKLFVVMMPLAIPFFSHLLVTNTNIETTSDYVASVFWLGFIFTEMLSLYYSMEIIRNEYNRIRKQMFSKERFGIKLEIIKNYYLFILPSVFFPFYSLSFRNFDLRTPEEEFADIRKGYNQIQLVKFYSYCTFLASTVIFFWWFIKQVSSDVVKPERIVFGYLLEFSVVLIVAVIFLSMKWKEEELHNDWKAVFREKFALQ